MSVLPIMAIAPIGVAPIEAINPVQTAARAPEAFSRLLMDGLQGVDRTVAQSDALAAAFVVDDTIPVHQVTFALEQSRLAVELMVQVRSRLVEGYQELMRMQL